MLEFVRNNSGMLKTILLFSGCFTLGTMILFSQVATTSIASLNITNNNLSLSTIALSILIASSALIIPPAGLMMQRWGYKIIFIVGAIFGLIGGILSGISLLGYGDFYLFCISMVPQGIAYGIVHYYRHVAATEVSTKSFAPYAISIVVLGGAIAGVLGPQISKWTKDLIPDHLFAATYFVYAGVELVHLGIIILIPIKAPSEHNILVPVEKGRPLYSIVFTSSFLFAAFSAGFTHLTMLALMAITDITVTKQVSFEMASSVLQVHFLGMFLPSLFTGKIIAKFGTSIVITFGITLSLIGQLIFFFGSIPWDFVSLATVGLGWNFAFIGSTTLVSTLYTPPEKFKVQASNDFIVFGLGSVMTLTCGTLLDHIGVHHLSFLLIGILLLIYIFWLIFGISHLFRTFNKKHSVVLSPVINE